MTWHVNFQLSSKAPKILVHMGLLQVDGLASFDLLCCRKYSCISDMVQSAMCVVGTLREHCHESRILLPGHTLEKAAYPYAPSSFGRV